MDKSTTNDPKYLQQITNSYTHEPRASESGWQKLHEHEDRHQLLETKQLETEIEDEEGKQQNNKFRVTSNQMTYPLFLLIAICTGGAGVIQSGVNVQLSQFFNSIILATCSIFIIGTTLSFLLLLWNRHYYTNLSFRDVKWYYYLGGTLGVVYTCLALLVVRQSGMALYYVSSIVGQLSMSSYLDAKGILGYKKSQMDGIKIIGLVMICCGAMLVQDIMNLNNIGMGLLMILLGLIGGGVQPVSFGLNNKIQETFESGMLTMFLWFFIGLLTILTLLCLILPFKNLFHIVPAEFSWWMWFGGIITMMYILSGIVVSPQLGSSTFFVCNIAGALIISTVTDTYGVFNVPQYNSISRRGITGLCFALIGSILISWRRSVNEQNDGDLVPGTESQMRKRLQPELQLTSKLSYTSLPFVSSDQMPSIIEEPENTPDRVETI